MTFSKLIARMILCLLAACQAVTQAQPRDTATVSVPAESPSGPSRVTIQNVDGDYQLLRNGEPYEIKGVGAKYNLKDIATAGANSIRTWDAKDIGPLLDEAHELGITVIVGFWLPHPGDDGFSYGDQEALDKETEEDLAFVKQYKDHPAVLMWALGNEMEGSGKDIRIFQYINELSQKVKAIDPNHPTMTVTAGVNMFKVVNFMKYCPDVDVFGPNIYGEDIRSSVEKLRTYGMTKPFIIPEFGPPGQWDTKTPWGAPIEMNSTDKARCYLRHYFDPILAERGWCIGSYAFYWQYDPAERQWPSWYSMVDPHGPRYGGADAMTYAWTGRWPDNHAPEIAMLRSEADQKIIKPGSEFTVTLVASDPDNDPIRVQWVLGLDHEISGMKSHLDQKIPESEFIADGSGKRIVVRAPMQEGAYRLNVFVYDDHNRAARASSPFYVLSEY
ncbi:MAG: glycoside hydrolase family 2 TIM barrel-domain containing protein [Phycisphaerales bacterium]